MHQQVVELYWESCWNARETDRLGDVFHDPYTHGRTTFSPTEMALIVDDTVASFPDLQVRVDEKHVDEDIVITRSTFLGTHGGPVFGLGATGNTVEVPSLDIFFFREGKVWRYWHLTDHLPILTGIGADVRLGCDSARWD